MHFIRKNLIFLFVVCCFVSCYYKNENCKPYYIGEFKIETNLITDSSLLEYTRIHKWDTVKLISRKDGKYFFAGADNLKECEGVWRTNSNNLEGNCFGHVKQKNMENEFIRSPFDIWIKISDKTYTLPFRKIDSSGNFLSPYTK